MEIKNIENDLFLKNMSNDELKALAKDIRSFILENVSKTGGHLSSNYYLMLAIRLIRIKY